MLLVARFSMLDACCSLLVARCSLLVARCSLLVAGYLLKTSNQQPITQGKAPMLRLRLQSTLPSYALTKRRARKGTVAEEIKAAKIEHLIRVLASCRGVALKA